MKKIFFIILCIMFTSNLCFAEDEILLETENLVPDESVLEEETPFLESEVEKNDLSDILPTLDQPNESFLKKLSNTAKDVYRLQIENTSTPSCLLKEPLTHHFEKGPLESVHIWTGIQTYLTTDIAENDTDTNFKVGLINNFIDGTFKGGKENFRIMLDPTPQNNRTTIQHLFQDLYIDTNRIPHHRILIGNSRPAVGYEGAGSSYTLPLANRAQISRNFGTVRKLGVRVMGNYSLLDYDLGGYSSETYFTSFFPGAEFDGWVNFKPLGKTDGKYGKLTLGGGIASGKRDGDNFLVSGAYLGYEYKKLWFRAEYANADGSNGLSGFTTKQRQGWYATLGYKITKKLEAVIRYDEFDPDKNISHNNKREYTAGINYYIKGQALELILNYVFCQNDSQPNSHKIILGLQIAI